jgi:hypothetical protein
MVKISNEQIRVFSQAFDKCVTRLETGGVNLDTEAAKEIVRKSPDVAERVIHLDCKAAVSNPAYFQGAMVIAAVYHAVFDDDRFVRYVHEKAKESDGEEWVARLFSEANRVPLQETPERKAAQNWWRSNDREEARCDNCNRRLLRGEGFLISGRVFTDGYQRLDMGDEIICEKCFREVAIR